jgi:hypothetical protein
MGWGEPGLSLAAQLTQLRNMTWLLDERENLARLKEGVDTRQVGFDDKMTEPPL